MLQFWDDDIDFDAMYWVRDGEHGDFIEASATPIAGITPKTISGLMLDVIENGFDGAVIVDENGKAVRTLILMVGIE